MPTVIRYAPQIINIIEIDAIELISIPFYKIKNLVLSDRRFYKLYNEILHYCRSRRDPSSRECINIFYKCVFMSVAKQPLGFEVSFAPQGDFAFIAAPQRISTDIIFFSGCPIIRSRLSF